MQTIRADQALIGSEWVSDVLIRIGDDGRIRSILSGAAIGITGEMHVGALLPAPVNLHSHTFQRAMAGMTERRGPAGQDSFWTWRQQMYRFLEALTPEDVEAIAAFAQIEMLEAGFAAVAEFHYLHQQPDGLPYDDPAELSARIAAAAQGSGIGLILLPVLYQQGSCGGAPLGPGQVRFGMTIDGFARLLERAREIATALARDAATGVAPHSLRAVSAEGLTACVRLAQGGPVHMHLAEQAGEVEQVKAIHGRRPAEWLLDHHEVNARWCLVHATHLTEKETALLARTGAVAGLCPITESNLGDGIFNGVRWLEHGGRFGIGSDSNIRISLAEELRTLEYSQRLHHQGRAMLALRFPSAGRSLYQGAAEGGAQAAGRSSGVIAEGNWADLLALDLSAVELEGRRSDEILDSYVFAGDDRLVQHVWSAGRHLVREGRHVHREWIETRYRRTMNRLRNQI